VPAVRQVAVLGSSVFLLIDQRVAIIDSGPPGSAGRVLAALRRAGRSADDVEHILITHYHPDHLGGLAELLRHVPARVGVHAAEAPAVCGEALMPAPLRYPRLAERLAPMMRFVQRCPVDTVLGDGDELPVLGGLRVIHTPGHTPGHIALHLPEHGVVIAGDALQRRATGLTPPARLVTADWAEALRSVQRLATLEFEVLALSHFPPLRGQAVEHVRRLAAGLAAPSPGGTAPSPGPSPATRERGALRDRFSQPKHR
jgi:glyoxylase-like metal-dependent hydrolase (beta-lactamase superfamily II)